MTNLDLKGKTNLLKAALKSKIDDELKSMALLESELKVVAGVINDNDLFNLKTGVYFVTVETNTSKENIFKASSKSVAKPPCSRRLFFKPCR